MPNSVLDRNDQGVLLMEAQYNACIVNSKVHDGSNSRIQKRRRGNDNGYIVDDSESDDDKNKAEDDDSDDGEEDEEEGNTEDGRNVQQEVECL
jgi:hypothetical protein